MISLGRRCVQDINRTYRRAGTLRNSRYKSSLVQEETYLLVCQRYIELNPVGAGMVDDPGSYGGAVTAAMRSANRTRSSALIGFSLALGADQVGRLRA